MGSLVALYGPTVHVALYSDAIASFSVCNTAKLGIGPRDKPMNLAVTMW